MSRSLVILTFIFGFSASHAGELPAKHLVDCYRSHDACHDTSVAYISGLRQGIYGVYQGQKEPNSKQIAECVVTRKTADIINRIVQKQSPDERQDVAIFIAIYSLCTDAFNNASRPATEAFICLSAICRENDRTNH